MVPVSGLAAVPPVHRSTFGFAKSKALLGLLGPVSRARVMDLWSDDLDRPPNTSQRVSASSSNVLMFPMPFFFAAGLWFQNRMTHWRFGAWHASEVIQRGVPGTREILENFVDGLELPEGDRTPIFVVDLMMTRPLGCYHSL